MTSLLGASAGTFGRRILLSRAAARELARGTEWGRRLYAHELEHVAQYARDGFVRFLVRYVADYVHGRRQGLTHDAAYAAIPYEREAMRAEGGRVDGTRPADR